jgi:outer membrane protein insertion porin family
METVREMKQQSGSDGNDALRRCRAVPAILSVALCVAVLILFGCAAKRPSEKPARVKISGFGIFGDREMARLLRTFQTGPHSNLVDRAFVEDASLILFSRLNSLGYLNAKLQARFIKPDGAREQMIWTNALEVEMPPNFTAREVDFRARGGVRFYYQSIEITGLKAMPERDADEYFVAPDALFRIRANRIFNPQSLKSSVAALRDALVRKGYRDAAVQVSDVRSNDVTGAVFVKIAVAEGLPTIVRSVTVEVEEMDGTLTTNVWTQHLREPYSPLWQQDLARDLRNKQYARGFPDATAELSVVRTENTATNIQMDLFARVKTGRLIRLNKVKFEGNQITRESVLKSRVKLKPGAPLNRLEAEKSRERLARLGVFQSVSVRYDDVTNAAAEQAESPRSRLTAADERETNSPSGNMRNVVYELKEAKPISLDLLAGYGSYELLRGGFEFEDRNVLGFAHDARLRVIQSFKASYADLQYTIPEIFGRDVDLFFRGSGLRRDEISFTREEYGGSVGLQKRFARIHTDFSIHYDYQFLNALNQPAVTNNNIGLQQARAASFVIDLNHDRRDNPLLPTRGYKLFSKVEVASAALGGNVDYLRVVFGGSYHVDLHGGRLLHFGLEQGLTFTPFGDANQLPFNKRFFPGGQDSIRGYQEGQASPLDAKGHQLGAETYTQGNFEFEQLLTHSWSVVTFFDAVGMAKDRRDYPWSEELFSVGGGFRWRTLIGPVRLEYGYNLNPRAHDPMGTLQFSIGFPF